jgi:putative redox protein
LAHTEIMVTSVSEGYTSTITAGHHMYYLDEPEKVGGHDLGPNPLQALLGALIGCETITAVAVAKEMDIDLHNLSFSVNGEYDTRGLKGDPNVRTYFENVKIKVAFQSNESLERINTLQLETERRCPVFNLLKSAGVKLVSHWEKA